MSGQPDRAPPLPPRGGGMGVGGLRQNAARSARTSPPSLSLPHKGGGKRGVGCVLRGMEVGR